MAADSQIYSGLSRAHLNFEFLHTSSTSHEFLFGALAEILDNSSDAKAKKIDVYTVHHQNVKDDTGTLLYFLDDGEGMNRQEVSNVITFGLSAKKALDPNQIGQYGNGLKSASMRIAKDLMIFTKKNDIMTCLMLSRTFYEREGIKEVIVPLPSFNVCNKTPLYDNNGQNGKDKHDNEMDLILKYSPFKTEREYFQQFDLIYSHSGTLVILYNLKLLDSGVTELDFESDPTDILMAEFENMTTDDDDDSLTPEKYSFRAYTSLLYLEPRMKIYIQKKKVQTYPLVYSLCKQMRYSYTSNRFKTHLTNEARTAEQELKSVMERLNDVTGQSSEIVRSWMTTLANNDQMVRLRQLKEQAKELQTEVLQKQIIFDKKFKALMNPKTLSFIFGLNLDNRNREGGFIYNCNRLIKMYTKVGPQLKGGMMCKGVVCIVNIPYQVLEPTCSKQDFADAKEYRHLIRIMGQYMEQYWKDSGMADIIDLNAYWRDFGYATSLQSEKACEELMYVNRRATESKKCLQCDTCLKWRILPFSSTIFGKAFPDDWTCAMNPDITRNECCVIEEKLNLPEEGGSFQKLEKSNFEKQKDIDDKIRKLEQKKNAICSKSQVRSSREAQEKMAERVLINFKTCNKISGDLIRRRRISSTRDISPEIGSSSSSKNKKRATMSHHHQFNEQRCMSHYCWNAENPDAENPDAENLDAENPDAENPDAENPDAENPDAENPDAENPDAENPDAENPDEKKTNQDLLFPQSDVTYNPNLSSNSGPPRRSRKVTKDVTGAKPKNFRAKNKQSNISSSSSGDANKELLPELSDNEVQEISASNSTTSSDADLCSNFKTILHYFMPPQFSISKDDVKFLTTEQLLNFDLPYYFNCQEDKINELIAVYRLEIQNKIMEAEMYRQQIEMYKQEATNAKTNQQNTIGLVKRLFNAVNNNYNLSPDVDSDKVNKCMELFIRKVEKAKK